MNTQVGHREPVSNSTQHCNVYIVIGQKVNMAARLMVKFGGCITCDEVTKTKSGLSQSQFKLIPDVVLKGISNPENIYEFSPEQ